MSDGFTPDEASSNSKNAQSDDRQLSEGISLLRWRVILNIVNGSVWGVLARKGLIALTTYSGGYLNGLVWANFAACLVMALLVHSSRTWSHIVSETHPKAGLAVYTGLTTGFCGTLSSFSSMMLLAFDQAAAPLGSLHASYRNHGYGVMEFLSVIIAQLSISYGGYSCGRHIIALIDDYMPVLSKRVYRLVEVSSMSLGLIVVVISCVLTGVQSHGSWRGWTFSIIFAPFGAISRYYLSKYLNKINTNFPCGTFAANVLGTLLLAVLTLINQGKVPNSSRRIVNSASQCQTLIGLGDGYCGALTTVSTLVTELRYQPIMHTYIYGMSLVIVSFALIVATLGAYNWAVGLYPPLC